MESNASRPDGFGPPGEPNPMMWYLCDHYTLTQDKRSSPEEARAALDLIDPEGLVDLTRQYQLVRDKVALRALVAKFRREVGRRKADRLGKEKIEMEARRRLAKASEEERHELYLDYIRNTKRKAMAKKVIAWLTATQEMCRQTAADFVVDLPDADLTKCYLQSIMKDLRQELRGRWFAEAKQASEETALTTKQPDPPDYLSVLEEELSAVVSKLSDEEVHAFLAGSKDEDCHCRPDFVRVAGKTLDWKRNQVREDMSRCLRSARKRLDREGLKKMAQVVLPIFRESLKMQPTEDGNTVGNSEGVHDGDPKALFDRVAAETDKPADEAAHLCRSVLRVVFASLL
jgi:hypothetical protein